MKYNPDKVEKLSLQLAKALSNLRRLAALDREQFLADPDKTGSAKYHFIVAIEAAIDLCNHIIAGNKLRLPEDYAGTFRVMHEARAFSEELTTSLVQMAKFRNRLVHIYWDVDDAAVYLFLQENLHDLESFLKEFVAFVNVEGAK